MVGQIKELQEKGMPFCQIAEASDSTTGELEGE